MTSKLPMTDVDGEVRELTTDDFKKFQSFNSLPEEFQALLHSRSRGRQKAPTKISTTVRFDADVVEAFKATGRGWQTRMNEVLKDWLREHPAS